MQTFTANWHGIALKASYHKLRARYTEFDPELVGIFASDNDFNHHFLSIMSKLSPVAFDRFNRAGTSTGKNPVYSYLRLVDAELKTLTPKDEDSPAIHELDRVVIHGEAFRLLTVDTQSILQAAAVNDFFPQRIDVNFDVSADFLPFSVVDYHFKNDLLTCTSAYHRWAKDDAVSWYAGTEQRNGFRVCLYESSKLHAELPEGAWRIEVQMFGKAAQDFTTIYLANPTPGNLTAYMLALLSNRIKFRVATGDTNAARRPVAAWWEEITAGAGSFSEFKPVTRCVREENRRKKLRQTLKAMVDRVGAAMLLEELGNVRREYPELFPI